MDIADQADKEMEMQMRANMNHAHRDVPEAIAIGECLFCGEPLGVGMRWCGKECRDDWEKEVSR
jgi:hypothetical protein